MSSNKHPKTSKPTDEDLKVNPGIGTSAGKTAAPQGETIEGENTIEGDVDNDLTRTGAVDPARRGRSNE